MNAVRSESSRARNPRRAAAMASRAAGPIPTSSRPNAARRKLSSVKSARRFTTTVTGASPGAGPGRPVRYRSSGLRRVPQEELPLRRRVDAGDVLLGCAQVVVEVGENDRGLIEQERLDLPGQLLLGADVDRRDELLRERVVLGVVEVGGIP